MQKFPQKHILIRLCHIYTGRQQWGLKKEKKKKTGKTLEKDKRTRFPLHISTHNFLLITSLGTSGHVAFALADIRKCNAQRPNPVKTTKSGFLSACLTWASWWGVRTEGKLMRWLVFFFCQDEQIENDNLQWGELGRWLATLRMRKAVVVSPFSWTSSHHKSFSIFFFFCSLSTLLVNAKWESDDVQTVQVPHLVEPACEGYHIWSGAVFLLLVPAAAWQLLEIITKKKQTKKTCY